MAHFRILFLLLPIFIFISPQARAVTGEDSAPGQSCSPNKAVRMTANPTGVGAYILTCENGKWEATITARAPTADHQVATKKYVDDALADSIATIDTHTYSNVRRWTDAGENLPLLVTGAFERHWGSIASFFCSELSGGTYVQGKILSSQRRNIHSGTWVDSSTGQNYSCDGSCITGPSGNSYAWFMAADILSSSFYMNVAPGHFRVPDNMPKVTTKNCDSWPRPGGTVSVNGECMANPTATRSTVGGSVRPNLHGGSWVINEITCWSN